jgi:ribose transport system permease protein
MTTTIERSSIPVAEGPLTVAIRWKNRAIAYPGLGVGVGVLVLTIALALTQERFLTTDNLRSVLEENSVLLVVAVGANLVMLTGAFDLSLGSLMSLAGVGFAWQLQNRVPLGVAILTTVVAAGMVALTTNGLLVGRFHMSFLVATLGTSLAFQSIANVWSNGQSTSLFAFKGVRSLGSGDLFGIPFAVIIAVLVWAAITLMLRFTGFGRMVYAVGGNSEAARNAGINPRSVRMATYAFAGLCIGIAAVLTSARLASVSPTVGAGRELTAATAVLLGGTSYTGGRGALGGTLLGVVFLGLLSNGITLFGVSAFWQGLVQGLVLVIAGGLQLTRNRGRGGRP